MQDVGVVIDLATHDLDLMRHLTDAEPERFHAETARVGRTQHEDFLIASLRFANGVLEFLREPSRIQRYGERALTLLRTKYPYARELETFVAIYSRLCGGGMLAPPIASQG